MNTHYYSKFSQEPENVYDGLRNERANLSEDGTTRSVLCTNRAELQRTEPNIATAQERTKAKYQKYPASTREVEVMIQKRPAMQLDNDDYGDGQNELEEDIGEGNLKKRGGCQQNLPAPARFSPKLSPLLKERMPKSMGALSLFASPNVSNGKWYNSLEMIYVDE